MEIQPDYKELFGLLNRKKDQADLETLEEN
jgi:hypothetical protein